jgi:parallel beta-helix repeat protein
LLAFLLVVLGGVALAQIRVRINRNADGSIALDWNARTGLTYQVSWRSNLSEGTPWLLLESVRATNATAGLTDTGAVDRIHPAEDLSRFYRVREGVSTSLSNDITGDVLLDLAGSPYYLTRSIRVRSGARLRIEPGVTILCSGGVSLTVEGILSALGTAPNPITFTSASAAGRPGDWEGLRFLDASVDAACVLSNVVVEFARLGVFCQDASPQIVACRVRAASQHGIQLERSSPRIQGCTLERNGQDGVYCADQSMPLILNNTIVANGSDGVEFTGAGGATDRNSRPQLNGNTVIGNSGFAVRSAAQSRPAELVINARSNWWGTADPAQIAAVIFDYTDSPGNLPIVDVGNWLGAAGGAPTPGMFASGPVRVDTTWQAANSPVHIFSTIVVSNNATLTIEAGVEVWFHGSYRLDVNGALRALGSASARVQLTGGDPFPLPGDWEGVRFLDSSVDSACVLSNVVVEFARTGVTCQDASPTIIACEVANGSQYGIYVERGSPWIEGCTIERNGTDGVYCTDQSAPLLLNNRIVANGQDGVEFTGMGSATDRNSRPQINGNTIVGNGGFAVRSAAQYRPAEVVINARSNWWGTADPLQIAAAIFDYTDSPGNLPIVDVGNWLEAADGAPVPGLFASGPVRRDTTWRTADSPVHVFSTIVVSNNATLTIEAGVEVWFHGFYRLDVNGTLRALGSSPAPVWLTGGASFPLPGDWEGVRFLDSSVDSACVLSNVVIEFARTGVSCQDASPTLSACEVADCSQYGIFIERGSPLLQQCAIDYNGFDGVLCTDSSAPQILGCRIFGNGQDGIELSGGSTVTNRNSRPVINNTLLYGNASFAVRALANYRPAELEIDARFNWWGTADPRAIVTDVFDYTDNPNGSPVVNFGNWQTAPGGPTVPGRAVSGPVLGSATWRTGDSPIALVGPVQVASNAALTIEAGIAVTVYGNYRFDISGILKVNGLSNAPVTFAPEPGFRTPGAWPGIRFTDTSVDAECVVSNVAVEFAQNGFEFVDASPQLFGCRSFRSGTYGMLLTRSSPLFQGCSVLGSRLTGIQCTDRSSPLILASLIVTNGDHGLYCHDRSSPTVASSLILSNAGDGIQINGASTTTNRNSVPVITGNEVVGNGQFALRALTYYRPAETRINARSNWWGTADALVIAQEIFDYNDAPTQSPVVDYGNWLGYPGGPAQPGTFLTGPILGNTVWHANETPFSVIGHLLVSSNAALTIEPGVEVLFLGDYRCDVDGELQALGTFSDVVVFTSGRPLPAKGDWPGLNFTAASSNRVCVLSNVVIEFADKAVNCLRTSPRIAQSQIRQNTIGLTLDTSASWISGNLIEFNDTGISCLQYSTPLIEENTITLSRNNGVEVVSSSTSQDRNPRPVLARNSIFGNGTGGGSQRYNLYTASFFQAASNIVNAVSNWWGTTDTNLIDLAIFDRRDSGSSPTVSYQPVLAANTNFAVVGSRGSSPWFSPNMDGNLDALMVDSTLTHGGAWSVLILDSAGQVQRRMPGNGTTLSEVWDGTDNSGQPVPEGRYRAVVFATNGVDGRLARAYADATRLDRVRPVAEQQVPTLPDGTVANDLIVNGTASDSGILLNWLLEYGAGANPTTFSLLASNNTRVADGLLVRLDSRLLSNGVYTLRLRVQDYAGNVTVTQMLMQVDNVRILNPAALNVFFDPASSSSQIRFDLNRDSDVVVKICPADSPVNILGDVTVDILTNSPIRTFGGRLAPGTHTFSWNGRDQVGLPITNRLYAFIIEAVSDHGRSDAYNPPYVAGPVSFTNFVVGTNFNFYANEPCAITYSLFAPAFVMLAVQFRPYPVIFGEPRDTGPHTEYWQGRSLADNSLLYGEFIMALKTQVLPENVLVIERVRAPALRDVQAESYLITPTYSEVSEVRYTLDRATTVTVRLRDPNGNLITLEDQVSRGAGTHRVEWNAQNAAGQVVNLEGDYEVVVTAYEPASGLSEVKSANLRVRQ